MPFSSGVYTLPNPALVTGEVVSATENNTTRNDLAGALNLTMLRNGTSTATANLPMGGYKLTGLGAPTTNGDSLAYGAAAVVTTLTSTSLTATRVPYAGTGGLLQDASTFTFDGTTLTAGGFSTAGSFTLSGGTANGVAYLNGSKVLTTGSALQFDGSNLGLGVTPSAWSQGKVVEVGSKGSAFWGYGATQNFLTANAYFDGAWKYGSNGVASYYTQDGSHRWFTAPSGTAGNAISFTQAMTLDASGNLGVGTPTATSGYRIRVQDGNSATGFIATNVSGGYCSLGLDSAATSDGRITWTNALIFGASGSERMRIDSSGNVGIGTSSPVLKFNVASSVNDNGIRIENTSSASTTAKTTRISFWGTDTAGSKKEAANIYAVPNDVNYISSAMKFFTRTSDVMYERMSIQPNGSILMNTTSSFGNAQYSMGFNGAVINGISIRNTAAAGAPSMIEFQWGAATVGSIFSNGTSTAYNTSSDYRLKENIQPMQNALARNALLKPCTYSWKVDGSTGEGFIAHELQAVVPGCVTGEKDAVDKDGKPVYQGVDTSFLVGHLVACIQELKAELDATKAEVAALKGN